MTKQKIDEKNNIVEGTYEADAIETVSAKKERTKSYNFEALKNAMLATPPQKYVLPAKINNKNTAYQIRKKLRAIEGCEKVTFAYVKGTTQFVFLQP